MIYVSVVIYCWCRSTSVIPDFSKHSSRWNNYISYCKVRVYHHYHYCCFFTLLCIYFLFDWCTSSLIIPDLKRNSFMWNNSHYNMNLHVQILLSSLKNIMQIRKSFVYFYFIIVLIRVIYYPSFWVVRRVMSRKKKYVSKLGLGI